MAEDVYTLFDDYAARFARGERPSTREYVSRAGERGEEIAQLLDAFLARAVPPEPDEDVRAAAEAWLGGESPLLALRVRRGLKRDGVVDALIRTLDLDAAKREKVKRYYHQLETGLLEPKRVDASVWSALATILRGRVEDLFAWRPQPPAAPAAMYMRKAERGLASAAPFRQEPEPPDEIDRLFTGA